MCRMTRNYEALWLVREAAKELMVSSTVIKGDAGTQCPV
jgi:hypothetical protein